MSITITQEHIYFIVIGILMLIQIYQWRVIFSVKDEIQKIWDQLSVWNTMVAMKLLETQKDIDKLNNKENKNGEQTKKDS